MSMPEDLNPIAARVYEAVTPVTYDDAVNSYALAHFIEAWTRPMLVIEEIAGGADGNVGWSVVFNPDTAPALFLNWLSIIVGSIPRPGETEEQARIRIKGMTGLRRGTRQAMQAAATRYLDSGDPDVAPYVIFNERAGDDAYHIAVQTLDSQTPDPDAVQMALEEQKPMGNLLFYDSITDPTYGTLYAAYDTYQEVYDAYPDYGHVVVDLPA